MKKIIKAVLAVLAILVVAICTVPFLIPAETYKKEITRAIYEATGREVTISGKVSASIYPSIGAKVDGVTLSNAPGFGDKPMLTLKQLDVEVALVPLFSKEVQIQRFVLHDPVIALAVNAKGKPNWEFTPPAKKEAAVLPPQGFSLISSAQADELIDDDVLEMLEKLKLGVVEMHNGTIHFTNAQTGAKQSVSEANLTLGFKDLNSPITVKGDAVWNKEKVDISLEVKEPRKMVKEEASPMVVAINAAPISVDFNGQVSAKNAQGALKVKSPSLVKLAAWTGSPMDYKGGALALDTAGQLTCTQTECAYKQSTITLDSLALKGDVSANFGGTVPYIKANLATSVLDLNPWMKSASAEAPTQFLALLVSSAHAAEPAAGWSTDPIDLSGLKAVNLDATFKADAVKHDKLTFDKVWLEAGIHKGALLLNVKQLGLYDGGLTGKVSANASGNIGADIALSKVNVEKLLVAMGGDDRLSGTLALNLSVSGVGKSQRAIIGSLNGKGDMKLVDGALKGVNLAQMVRAAKSAITQQQNVAEKTDFAELGGTFTITNGVVSNQDLGMKAPALRLSGAGTVNLPKMWVNYRLLPELVASLKGQGGKDKAGITVPIIVEGPLTKPTYRPDLEGMLKDALTNPEKTKETVKQVEGIVKGIRDNPKEGLDNLIKGFGL